MSKNNNKIGMTDAEKVAFLMTRPTLQSATIGGKFLHDGASTLEAMQEINRIIAKVKNGDMSDIEALLIGQALSLNAIFTSYAHTLVGTSMSIKEAQYKSNIAMKAQSQSRAAIEALTALKYPRQVVIAKQANIAQGHQQVNNGGLSDQYAHAHTHTQAREISNQSNELLEGEHGTKTMDGQTATIAARENLPMETVATQHRCKNGRG